MKNIERLGKRYCKDQDCLGQWKEKEKELQNNWWEALKFFFSHSFMRGRRDELSIEYYYFTIQTLEDYFCISNWDLDKSYENLTKQEIYFKKECILKFKKVKNLGKGNSIKHQDFKTEVSEKNPIINLLVTPKEVEVQWNNKTYEKKIFLGNDADVMMVLDVLEFISSDNQKNIYNYLKGTITKDRDGVKKTYEELTKMRGIEDKIATFIIRDAGLLNPGIVKENHELAFPVDTWVKKIAQKIGCNKESTEEIKKYLIKKCKDEKIDPLKFAAGLWFLGFHSLDILIENCLCKIKLKV